MNITKEINRIAKNINNQIELNIIEELKQMINKKDINKKDIDLIQNKLDLLKKIYNIKKLY
ncbi:MAG: hypothetical protein VW333_12695 [Pseudomonadales bacterium]